jgi:hypothetical protein
MSEDPTPTPASPPDVAATIARIAADATHLEVPWTLPVPTGTLVLDGSLHLTFPSDAPTERIVRAALRFFAGRAPPPVDGAEPAGTLGVRTVGPLGETALWAAERMEGIATLLWQPHYGADPWASLGRWDSDPSVWRAPTVARPAFDGVALVEMLGSCDVRTADDVHLFVRRVLGGTPGPEVIVVDTSSTAGDGSELVALVRARTGMHDHVRALPADAGVPLPLVGTVGAVCVVDALPPAVRDRVIDRLWRALANRDLPSPAPSSDASPVPAATVRARRPASPRWEWIGPVEAFEPIPAPTPPLAPRPTTLRPPEPAAARADGGVAAPAPHDADEDRAAPHGTDAEQPIASEAPTFPDDRFTGLTLVDAGPDAERTAALLARLLHLPEERARSLASTVPAHVPRALAGAELTRVNAALRASTGAWLEQRDPPSDEPS